MPATGAATGRATDEALRSPGWVALALALAVGVCLLPAIPAVEAVLGVGPVPVAIAMATFAVTFGAGALVYRRHRPGSRVYAVFDRVETAIIQISMLSLVIASGRGDSFFWLLWIAHAIILGLYATHVRFNVALLVTLPVLVALAFLLGGRRLDAAAISVFVGALGAYLYGLGLTVSRRLIAVDAERARLADELADTRVRQERERIARDIHDGVGADLAALDWRLRSLRGESGSDLDHEIDELVNRLAHGTSELRGIVWALRTPSRRWSELVAYLRQRIAELGAHTAQVEVTDAGVAGAPDHPGERALDYLRAVLELVHNAARHAGASRISVVLRASPAGLEAEVEDDGRGLPAEYLARDEGGLANLRARTERAGGELELAYPVGGGTRLAVRFPATGSSVARPPR